MATESNVVNLTHDHETCGKARKASLRDMLSSMDASVTRTELAVGKYETSSRIPTNASKDWTPKGRSSRRRYRVL